MGGWMGSVARSAQDPIFYLHHSNVDRLWNLWLYDPTTRIDQFNDASWKNRRFTFFNENRERVQMTTCEVLNAAQQLNYTYEQEPAPRLTSCDEPPRGRFRRDILREFSLLPITLGAFPITIDLDITQLQQQIESMARSNTATLFLELDNVEADRPPGAIWAVYVGAPARIIVRDDGSLPDPQQAQPYFVGNVALFSSGIRSEAHHHFTPAHIVLAD
jgi:tyrosinase